MFNNIKPCLGWAIFALNSFSRLNFTLTIFMGYHVGGLCKTFVIVRAHSFMFI